MSERWKYQIKFGGFWGILTGIFIALSDLTERSFQDAFLSKRFVFRELVFFLTGIFVMGYVGWKEKNKETKIKL